MGRGESILVVDDVKNQRKLAFRLLSRLGYNVETVNSGEDAVEHLKSNRADLIVLDMIMEAGIDGLDTYREAIKLHPGQRAILVSGFMETERTVEAQHLGAGVFVQKPYMMEILAMAVRKELDRK